MTNVLLGSLVTLAHQFTTSSVVTVSSASLTVKLPDGTTRVISVTPPSAVQNPTAQCQVQFNVPGAYALYWGIVCSDGQTIIEQDDYFTPYSAIHRFVRERLNATSAILPDAPLDSALCFVSRLVLRRVSDDLASYAVVPVADISTFDQALALTAAAYLRPLTPKTVASGELTTVQIGTDKWQYSELASRANNPLDAVELQWMDQAGELIMSCSFVTDNDKGLTNMPMFQLAGPRRYARTQMAALGAAGAGPDSTTPLYQLWGDLSSQWAWERGQQQNWI